MRTPYGVEIRDSARWGPGTIEEMPSRVCFINPFQVGGRGPQGLKPAFLLVLNGTAEAVPYPKPISETHSRMELYRGSGPAPEIQSGLLLRTENSFSELPRCCWQRTRLLRRSTGAS